MINIVLTFSRPYALERVASLLEALQRPKDTNLLVIADVSPKDFLEARNRFNELNYAEKLVLHYNTPTPFNRPILEYETIIRRQRISDIHNFAKQHLWAGDYVLVIEDDDIVPPESLNNLLEVLMNNPEAGAITGWQVSRHNKAFVGAYTIDNLEKPMIVTSALPGETDEIDACGLYFLLVKQSLYETHNFKPWGNAMGPDVDFAVSIRKQGYKVLIDWSTPIPHFDNKIGQAVSTDKLYRATVSRGEYAWNWTYYES